MDYHTDFSRTRRARFDALASAREQNATYRRGIARESSPHSDRRFRKEGRLRFPLNLRHTVLSKVNSSKATAGSHHGVCHRRWKELRVELFVSCFGTPVESKLETFNLSDFAKIAGNRSPG